MARTVEEKISFEDARGSTVVGILTRPVRGDGGLAVLCHGFLSGKDSTTNRMLTDRLTAIGIGTFRFDFFGHGESDGPFEEITVSRCAAQLEMVLDRVRERGVSRPSLVGSSFGGLVALAAASRGQALERMALRCPVVDYPAIWKERLGADGMSRWKKENRIPHYAEPGRWIKLNFPFYEDLKNFDILASAPSIIVPTLILHGDEDEYVPYVQSTLLDRELGGEKDILLVPGADHGFTRPEDFRRMLDEITGWIAGTRGVRRTKPTWC